MTDFSVVIPIKDKQHIAKNLPSWCQLKPEEILLCFDKPVPKDCVELVEGLIEKHEANIKIVVVGKNNDYRFHQAWVRREGFRMARNETILTGDIDLQVYATCLKAVSIVGENRVGLVSLMKVRCPSGMQGKLRFLMDRYIQGLLRKWDKILTIYYYKLPYNKKRAYFTGLYALYRPFWLDTEDESIKDLENPKYAPIIHDQWGSYQGEDTYLKNCMQRKYKCIFLEDVGAKDLGIGLEETESIQPKIGAYYFKKGERPNYMVKGSIVHVRPKMLGSYMHHLAILYGGVGKAWLQTMRDIIQPWLYWWTRKLIRLFMGKDRTREVLVKYGFRYKLQEGILSDLKRRLK